MANEDAGLAVVAYSFASSGAPGAKLKVRRVHVDESISEGYRAELEIVTEDEFFEPASLLGEGASLEIARASLLRSVFGVVYRVETLGQTASKRVYRVHFGPAMNSLRFRTNTRIFQHKTLPEIIEEVILDGIQRYGSSLENRLTGEYKKLEYCVQYRETDLDFVRRLMQEAGIAHWFDHGAERELLILSDSTGDFVPVQTFHEGPIKLLPSHFDRTEEETLQAFHWGEQLESSQHLVREYDWTRPGLTMEGQAPPDEGSATDDDVYTAPLELRYYDYEGGRYQETSAQREAEVRVLRGHIRMQNGRGRSNLTGLQPGTSFVYGPDGGEPMSYTVTRVTHRGATEREVASAAREAQYENEFEFILGGQYFVPERSTPRPRIHSTQTAKVVGPAGEEIHTDEHGRVRVQFHWDAQGSNNEQSSCFIRVMQPTAGPGFGHVFLPRIGMEVVVSFLEGNPDRPLITGTVYNGENRPPYALPEHKTRSTIKTNTTPGGGGFNELRFEDKAGGEEIYLHAQKDLNEVVNNDHTTKVGHDQTIEVKNDQVTLVTQNQENHVGVNQLETVGADQRLMVQSNRSVEVSGNFSETINGQMEQTISQGQTVTVSSGGRTTTITEDDNRTVTGNETVRVLGNQTETIEGVLSQTVTGNANSSTGGNLFVEASENTHLKTGNKFDVTATEYIHLNAGSGNIMLNASQVAAVAESTQWLGKEESWYKEFSFAVTGTSLDHTMMAFSLFGGCKYEFIEGSATTYASCKKGSVGTDIREIGNQITKGITSISRKVLRIED